MDSTRMTLTGRRERLQQQLAQAQQEITKGQQHVARFTELAVRLDAQLALVNELDQPEPEPLPPNGAAHGDTVQ
jgi:uncharacterized membrane protein YccC